MRPAVSIDYIKAELNGRIDELVPKLFRNARLIDGEWAIADLSGAPGQSLRIPRRGQYAGRWCDFNPKGHGKGDVLHLIAAAQCDGDIGAAIAWARDFLNLGDLTPAQQRHAARVAETSRARVKALRELTDQEAREKKRRAAQGLWIGAQPLAGSPAERYLLGRAIDLRRLGKYPGALRYAPAAWCAETKTHMPALVATVNDAETGEQIAAHRTYLAIHGDGRVTKAELEDAKRSLGSITGGHIPLARGASGRPMREAPAGEWIATTEGIEDGLSVALAKPALRVICGVSLNRIGEVKLPPQIGGLYLVADNDPDDTVLMKVLARLEEREIATHVVRAPAPFKDFNEWLQSLAGGAGGKERGVA